MKKTKKVKYAKRRSGTRRTAAVSELKAELSAYLARVKAGEEVVVTERGTPVAKLVPIPQNDDPEWDRMRKLAAQGLVQLPSRPLPEGFWKEFWSLPRPEDPEGLVLKALLDERESGW